MDGRKTKRCAEWSSVQFGNHVTMDKAFRAMGSIVGVERYFLRPVLTVNGFKLGGCT